MQKSNIHRAHFRKKEKSNQNREVVHLIHFLVWQFQSSNKICSLLYRLKHKLKHRMSNEGGKLLCPLSTIWKISLLFFFCVLELYPYLQGYVVAENFHFTEYRFSLFFQNNNEKIVLLQNVSFKSSSEFHGDISLFTNGRYYQLIHCNAFDDHTHSCSPLLLKI